MRSLQQMIRVHRWTLDEKRQRLGELEALRDRLEADLAELDRVAESESSLADKSLEGAITFPAYISSLLVRKQKLQLTLGELEASIDEARDALSEAFQEVKRYELAADRAAQRRDMKQRRREALIDNELGLETYRRRVGMRE